MVIQACKNCLIGGAQVPAPLTSLQAMPALKTVDFRGIHETSNMGYWPEAKCTTMSHVTDLTKSLKRRPYATKVLIELD